MPIEGVDFIAVPSTNADRAAAFYGEVLGLRPDPKSKYEFWAGPVCFGIWEPEQPG